MKRNKGLPVTSFVELTSVFITCVFVIVVMTWVASQTKVTERVVDVPHLVTVSATDTTYVRVEIPHCADEKMAVEQAVQVIGTLPYCGMVDGDSAKPDSWCNDCLPAADNPSSDGSCPMRWSTFLEYNR